jgi:hypothetical protein
VGRHIGQIERGGPFLDVKLMASPQRVAHLKAVGLPFPAPKIVRSLIDTGASCSAFDEHLVGMLGLVPTGLVPIATPTTGGVPVDRYLYDVSVVIGDGRADPRTYTIGMVASGLASEGFTVLIGWDILSRCVLRCDGPNGMFTLDY